jgi:hypothetical protein
LTGTAFFLIGAPGVSPLLTLLAGLPAYPLAGFAVPALAEPITRWVYRLRRQQTENDSASSRPRAAAMASRQSFVATSEGCGFAAAEKRRGLVSR